MFPSVFFTTGVVIHDANTEVLFSNQAALNLLGLSMDQIKGKSSTDSRWCFIREDGINMPLEEFPVNQVLSSKKAMNNIVVGVLRPDLDHPMWAVCNAHPEFDQNNVLSKIVVNFTDITDRKMAENELTESELRYRTIVETSEEGVWTIDVESRTTFVNRKMANILGYSCEEMLGKPMFYFMDEEGKTIALINLQKRKDGFHEQHEFRLKHKNGRDVWTSMATSSITNRTGTYIGALAMVTDITERKQAEDQLIEIAEKLSKTYALAHIGVWNWVISTDTVVWSEELYRIAGLDPKLPPPSFAQMEKMHSHESWIRLQDAVANELKTGESYQLEMEFCLPDGGNRNVNAYGGVKRNRNGNIIELFGTVQDITEKKQAEIKLKAALNTAKTAVNIKSRFLDIAAHELRTPVSAFSLLLQFTQKKLETGSPVDIPTLVRLRSQVERISQLVVELLDVSRLERGVLTLKPERINIVAMVTHCIEDFKLRKPDREIVFLSPENVLEINIDPLRIFQVLSNLIDNAIKYTPDDSPIKIGLEQKPGIMRLSIQDFGQGITDKNQEALFAPFSRGSTEFTEQYGGLGLGLFISREIISLHGGTIGVKSNIGSGSTFYFELPTEIKKI